MMINGTLKRPLLSIVGPTAVGKTALALAAASQFGGEIVSADSRQVYIGMDIGTAKPTAQQIQLVPHHLVSILHPGEILTVADFRSRAEEAITEIQSSGMLPVLVGGTGQYVKAVIERWSIPAVPPAYDLRVELESFARIYGPSALHARLKLVDGKAAATLDYRNVRRVVRALEVIQLTGRPFSELKRRDPKYYDVFQIGLTLPRSLLYHRIDRRIDEMITQGLADEVHRLVLSGYGWDLPSMSALGYGEFREFFAGKISLDEVATLIKTHTHAFVRKQYNWFRLSDAAIHWFDAEKATTEEILMAVSAWLNFRSTDGSS
jgi:tRNA dimethylallyltransferase